MRIGYIVLSLILLLPWSAAHAQRVSAGTEAVLDSFERLQSHNKPLEALELLQAATRKTSTAGDLAYLYAFQSALYTSMDSLRAGKEMLDLSMENAEKSKKNTSMAVAYRAKAFINYILNLPDATVEDALTGLRYLGDSDEDPITAYNLNYLLYSIYSRWDDEEKMRKYIGICAEYAAKAESPNLQVNVNNGLASMYLAKYRKTHQAADRDSNLYYLNNAFALYQAHPEEVSGNTTAIICINLAFHYLELVSGDIATRKQHAFEYLDIAEEKLRNKQATAEKWANVYGIRNEFAQQEGNLSLAEQYLQQGLVQLISDSDPHFKLQQLINESLSAIAQRKNDFRAALMYQKRADEMLRKAFDEQQLQNAQKLEIQYETEKKDQQLQLLNERAEFRKRQNYLYGGIAVALAFAAVFVFLSYRFKLKYSVERERKLQQEKEETERQMALQLQLEKEEQARLKAEQELMELKRLQLEKETLTNSLIIEHKNDTLKQIQDKIREGDTGNIQKLLKAEMLVRTDFDDIKTQIQELHPNFFGRLTEEAQQKLTPLDLKYCAYLYLKMTTKQIAQILHVAPQSVRMFKYRLKQKFGLDKADDLEDFLQRFG